MFLMEFKIHIPNLFMIYTEAIPHFPVPEIYTHILLFVAYLNFAQYVTLSLSDDPIAVYEHSAYPAPISAHTVPAVKLQYFPVVLVSA